MRAKLKFLLIALIISPLFVENINAKASHKTENLRGGVIKGKLVKSNGKPRPYTNLELVPLKSEERINDMRLTAVTTSRGIFSFKNVPEGKYTLSINFNETPTTKAPYSTHFYPNTSQRNNAKVFEVSQTSYFNNLIFRLPKSYKMRRFTGKIVWEDGEPVMNALISLVDLDSRSDTGFGAIKSNSNGIFKVTGFVGRRYQIAAILFDGDLVTDSNPQLLAQGFSKRFYLHTKTNIIKVTLKRPGKAQKKGKGLVGKLIY